MLLSLENITVAWEKRSVSQDYQRICAIPGAPFKPRDTLRFSRATSIHIKIKSLKTTILKDHGYTPVISVENLGVNNVLVVKKLGIRRENLYFAAS